METLNKKQLEAWRDILKMQGVLFVEFISDERIIAFYRKMKAALESPSEEKKCPPHKNIITGSRGDYCVDCENYI